MSRQYTLEGEVSLDDHQRRVSESKASIKTRNSREASSLRSDVGLGGKQVNGGRNATAQGTIQRHCYVQACHITWGISRRKQLL